MIVETTPTCAPVSPKSEQEIWLEEKIVVRDLLLAWECYAYFLVSKIPLRSVDDYFKLPMQHCKILKQESYESWQKVDFSMPRWVARRAGLSE